MDLPLALPSLMAGLRVATVIALAADSARGALEQRLTQRATPANDPPWTTDPRGGPHWGGPQRGGRGRWLRRRWRPVLAWTVLAAALLAAPAAWRRLAPVPGSGTNGTVVIGAKGTTEQLLLGELLAQEIEGRTPLRVKRAFSMGSTFLVHDALRQRRLDGYVEYTGTAWTAILRQPPLPPDQRLAVWQRARELYHQRFGLRMVPFAGDSTSGLIPALNLRMLEDDRHYFPPYDAVPVFNNASLKRHPELVAVVDQLAGRLSPATMQTLNAAVDLERRTPEEVVRRWRQEPSRASAPEPGGTGTRPAEAPGPGGLVSRHSGWRATHGG